MNFCSQCGSKDIHLHLEQDRFVRYICKSCETIHYKNPLTVVGCLPVYQGNQILLCRRGINPRKGFWNLPAGFMELNESVEEGAKREAKEETGLDVALIRLHSVYTSRKKNQVMLHFLATVSDLQYTLNEETTEIKLFHFDHIPWDELAFHSNVFAIENYLKGLKNQEERVYIGSSADEHA